MKRASSSYRLQLIREVAIRRERQLSHDPMADYIQQLISDQPSIERNTDYNSSSFLGSHFDEQAGGWVNDKWGAK